MLNYILNAVFGTSLPRVSDIVSDLERTAHRLDDFREMANTRIDDIGDQIADLRTEEMHLENEVERASSVSSKLRSLIS